MFLYYNKNEEEFKELRAKIPDYEKKRKMHKNLQHIIEEMIDEHTKEFLLLRDKIESDKEMALKKERAILRPDQVICLKITYNHIFTLFY